MKRKRWSIEPENLRNLRHDAIAFRDLMHAGDTVDVFGEVIMSGNAMVWRGRFRGGWHRVAVAKVSLGLGLPGSIEFDEARFAAEILITVLNAEFRDQWRSLADIRVEAPRSAPEGSPSRVVVLVFAPFDVVDIGSRTEDIAHPYYWADVVDRATYEALGRIGFDDQ
jgi:hypothetical protein